MHQCFFRFPDTLQAMQAYTTKQKVIHPKILISAQGINTYWRAPQSVIILSNADTLCKTITNKFIYIIVIIDYLNSANMGFCDRILPFT